MIKKSPIVLGAALGAAVVLAGLQICSYRMDHGPLLGRWRFDRMVRGEIQRLETGSDAQRMWAANRLGPMGMAGRADVREALTKALKDPNPTVAANARLSLHFFLRDESVKIDKETYRLAVQTPPDPEYPAR